ncbi:hypothetical protein SAMN02927921_01369 [Sinomicrobium oceani]|uniref:Uncharacterized protein n=1 Tax=Sinomicrobium oceani TaxID=1150368 RepID=A0A1K1NPG6_9FLAO|nr:hypothetical protein SAMN02927921_01369 [Sinomicrobium oceani]
MYLTRCLCVISDSIFTVFPIFGFYCGLSWYFAVYPDVITLPIGKGGVKYILGYPFENLLVRSALYGIELLVSPEIVKE